MKETKKLLSIVIPYYKTTEKMISPLLQSINIQIGVDFSEVEVLLVNDGEGKKFSSEFLRKFENLRIKTVLLKENRGPGVARQAGIDNCNGDYIFFSDADDILHSVGVIDSFIRVIKESQPDIIHSQWLEELVIKGQNNDRPFYITHDGEFTWMHGKVLKKSFLNQYGIVFDPILRVHEDTYFLAIATARTDKIVKVPAITYVWRYVPDSITRRNEAQYSFDSMAEFIKAVDKSFSKIETFNAEIMPYKINQFIMFIFFNSQNPDWHLPKNKKFKDEFEEQFVITINKFKKWYDTMSKEQIVAFYNEERARTFHGMEQETFNSWMSRLLKWETKS